MTDEEQDQLNCDIQELRDIEDRLYRLQQELRDIEDRLYRLQNNWHVSGTMTALDCGILLSARVLIDLFLADEDGGHEWIDTRDARRTRERLREVGVKFDDK